jgi:hypothetical protein
MVNIKVGLQGAGSVSKQLEFSWVTVTAHSLWVVFYQDIISRMRLQPHVQHIWGPCTRTIIKKSPTKPSCSICLYGVEACNLI